MRALGKDGRMFKEKKRSIKEKVGKNLRSEKKEEYCREIKKVCKKNFSKRVRGKEGWRQKKKREKQGGIAMRKSINLVKYVKPCR